MKILFIGDIVGRSGRNTVKAILSRLVKKYEVDLVVANGENLAGGKGMTEEKYKEMIEKGIDYFTSGHHIFAQKDFLSLLDRLKVLRPLNYPAGVLGKGYVELAAKGEKVAIINLQGQVFMDEETNNPFHAILEILPKIRAKNIVVDFHGEATSEKQAMGYFLDGKVSAVLGTHTHIQTSDAQILPRGTGYITDVGMVGAENSILGAEKEAVIEHFLTASPWRYEVAKGRGIFQAVIIELKDGKCDKIESINEMSKEG